LPLVWLDGVVSLLVIALSYVLARRFAGPVASAAAMVLLSLVFSNRTLADWGCNAEKFVALFELIACWLLLRAFGRPTSTLIFLGIGFCGGLAAAFKQAGVVFLAIALGTLIVQRLRGRLPNASIRLVVLI